MSLAVYKPEQGYWTRIMSAIGGWLLVAWFATWIWGKLQTITVAVDDQGREVIEPVYIQGGAVALILLIGGAIVYWLVYVRKPSSEFLIATDGEMKKVNWSTRREIIGSTWVVIGVSVLLAALLLVADIIFSFIMTKIGVLN